MLLRLLAFSLTGALPITKAFGRLQVHVISRTHAICWLEVGGLVTRVPHPTDVRTTLFADNRFRLRHGRRLYRHTQLSSIRQHRWSWVNHRCWCRPSELRTTADFWPARHRDPALVLTGSAVAQCLGDRIDVQGFVLSGELGIELGRVTAQRGRRTGSVNGTFHTPPGTGASRRGKPCEPVSACTSPTVVSRALRTVD